MEQTIISSEYIHAVKAIKQAILESRYRAARHVNKEVLALYYWVEYQCHCDYLKAASTGATWPDRILRNEHKKHAHIL